MQSPGQSNTALKEHLLRLMADEVVPVGGQLPPEKALMRQFSMSRSAVRKVLFELAVEGLIERHQGRGSFRTSPKSRPRQGRLVGVWLDWPPETAMETLAQGVKDELARQQYHCVIETSGSAEVSGRDTLESLTQIGMDGLVVMLSRGCVHDPQPLVCVLQNGTPLVLIDCPMPGHKANLVRMHYDLAIEEVIDYLVGLGHRRIGLLAGQGSAVTAAAYERSLKTHLLPADSAWLLKAPPVLEATPASTHAVRQAAWDAWAAILRLPLERRPTAFVCTGSVAGPAVEVARTQGLRVPEDLSIVRVEDLVEDASPTDDWLTLYAQPRYRIGVQAARLLVDQTKNSAGEPATILLQGQLIRRDSAVPPRPDAG